MTPFERVQIVAPVRKGSRERLPDTGSRQEGITAFFWTLREFVEERLLRFLFAEADDSSSQLGFVLDRVEAKLHQAGRGRGQARRPLDRDRRPPASRSFDDLVEVLTDRGPDGENRSRTEQWAGSPPRAPWPRSSAASPPRLGTWATWSAARTWAAASSTASTGGGPRPRSSTSTACTTAPSGSWWAPS